MNNVVFIKKLKLQLVNVCVRKSNNGGSARMLCCWHENEKVRYSYKYVVETQTMPFRSSHCTSCTSAIAKEQRCVRQSENRKVNLF